MFQWDLSWGGYDSVEAIEPVLLDDLFSHVVRKSSHKRTVRDGDNERADADLFT